MLKAIFYALACRKIARIEDDLSDAELDARTDYLVLGYVPLWRQRRIRELEYQRRALAQQWGVPASTMTMSHG